MSEVKSKALRPPIRILGKYEPCSSQLTVSVEKASNVVKECALGSTRDSFETANTWMLCELC